MSTKNIIVAVIVITSLLTVKFIFFPSEASKSNAQKQGKPSISNVSAFIVKAKKLSNEVYASGTVLANEEIQLQPELSGKIISLNFEEGNHVSKGQLLVKINDADLQANYSKLQLQYALAEEQLQRQKQLLAINGISKEEFDVIQNQHNSLKADMNYALAQIAKTEIKAPFDGTIGLKNVSEGAFVTPNTIIASIQQINPVKVDFSISEKYSSVVKKGDKVTFTVEGNAKPFMAQVFAVEPKIDLATRTLRMRAVCSNTNNSIYPGAFAKVQLTMSDIDSALMVPTEAVIPDLKGKKVYVIKNGKAETVKVMTGLRTDSEIQITEGLSVNDTVVTKGIMQLRPGNDVKIVELK